MLETRDLFLDKARQEDWRDMYERLWRHEESARYMFWQVTDSEEAARARMERTIAFEAQEPYALLVYEKVSHRAIGFAGMRQAAPGIYEEIGIALGPDYVGRGYGRQILNALTAEARRLGARTFRACCCSGNVASRALQISCGFRFVGTEEKTDERSGETYIMENYEKAL